jgi:hypothetical protein
MPNVEGILNDKEQITKTADRWSRSVSCWFTLSSFVIRISVIFLIHVALVAFVAFQLFDVFVCLLFGLAALFLNDFA